MTENLLNAGLNIKNIMEMINIMESEISLRCLTIEHKVKKRTEKIFCGMLSTRHMCIDYILSCFLDSFRRCCFCSRAEMPELDADFGSISKRDARDNSNSFWQLCLIGPTIWHLVCFYLISWEDVYILALGHVTHYHKGDMLPVAFSGNVVFL